MNKNEVINKLKEFGSECCIAEVICDIKRPNGTEYPNESIFVFLSAEDEITNDDQIEHYLHWTICESIADFQKQVMWEKDANKAYKMYGVTAFKEVKPFITDFNN